MSEFAFADTNLFLRIFTKDDPKQLTQVFTLLNRAADGYVVLVTNVMVLTEIVWVMEGQGAGREIIRDAVWSILNAKGIQVDGATLIGQAIDLYVIKNIDFVDAYNAVWMQASGIYQVYTFDQRHFARIPGIEAKLPG